jgi:hypothetical protein
LHDIQNKKILNTYQRRRTAKKRIAATKRVTTIENSKLKITKPDAQIYGGLRSIEQPTKKIKQLGSA